MARQWSQSARGRSPQRRSARRLVRVGMASSWKPSPGGVNTKSLQAPTGGLRVRARPSAPHGPRPRAAGLRCFTSRLRRPTRNRARCAGNLGLGPGALRQRRAPTLSAPALALGRDAPVLGAFAHLFLNLSLLGCCLSRFFSCTSAAFRCAGFRFAACSVRLHLASARPTVHMSITHSRRRQSAPRTRRAGEGVWRRLPRRLPRRALRYRHVLRIAEPPVRGRDGLRLHPERACRGARSSTCFACCVQAAAAYRFETLRSWPTALAFARSLSIFERVIGSRFSVAAGTAGPAMRAVPSGTEITRVTYASDNQSPARVRREGY